MSKRAEPIVVRDDDATSRCRHGHPLPSPGPIYCPACQVAANRKSVAKLKAKAEATSADPPSEPDPGSLTDRQREVFNFFVRSTIRDFYQPSFRDAAAHFGMNINAIEGFVRQLAAKGFVAHRPDNKSSRAIVFLRRTPIED